MINPSIPDTFSHLSTGELGQLAACFSSQKNTPRSAHAKAKATEAKRREGFNHGRCGATANSIHPAYKEGYSEGLADLGNHHGVWGMPHLEKFNRHKGYMTAYRAAKEKHSKFGAPLPSPPPA